jgi:hypothetical protein
VSGGKKSNMIKRTIALIVKKTESR